MKNLFFIGNRNGIVRYLLLLCLLCLFFFPVQTTAQVRMEVVPSGVPSMNNYIFYGTADLSNKIPYERIKGSPYWVDQFLLATLYDHQNRKYGEVMVRINLLTHRVNFINTAGEEFDASPEDVGKVVFADKKNNKVITVFRNDLKEVQVLSKKRDNYVQEMNQGVMMLLKLAKKEVQAKDSLFRTMKSFLFTTQNQFFIKRGELIRPIKRLNKENLLAHLPATAEDEKWAVQNGINFSSEEDVIRFLNYINERLAKKSNE